MNPNQATDGGKPRWNKTKQGERRGRQQERAQARELPA